MQTTDPFVQFKAAQREGWALFAPLEAITTMPAASLVKFSQLKPGQHVLDVACGTGVAAITAARKGAKVKALDLCPVLLERAKWNSQISQTEVDFIEGDVEALPYESASFDIVLSQYGHMFAPRPEIAIKEMLRVLKPGGTIAFSTWPPEHFTGQMFSLVSKYLPPPPGVAPTPQWGDPNIIRERLSGATSNLSFGRDFMRTPMLSAHHLMHMFEQTAAPLIKLAQTLKDDQPRLQQFRNELMALIHHFSEDNFLKQDFLMSRAIKN